MRLPNLPTGTTTTAHAHTRVLSDNARRALDNASQLGTLNPARLADELARRPDLERQQLLQELNGHLSARDAESLSQELAARGRPIADGTKADDSPVPTKTEGVDVGELALDLTQIGLDIVGIFDPTPISDGANALISLGRGDLVGAGLSALSIIPYVGDAAKLDKLGRYAQTVAKAVEVAARNPALRTKLAPGIQAIAQALDKLPLDKLPASAQKQLVTIKELTDTFARQAQPPTRAGLPRGDAAVHATSGAARTAARVGAQPLWSKYLDDIHAQTGLPVTSKQKELLDAHLAKNNHTRLSPEQSKAHRKAFNQVKNDLITQWESKTGQTWPRYTEDLYSKNGTLVRRAGQPYDAHHIVESSYGGPNEWWNMHPARFPDQHQQGIHRAGGPGSQVFP